MTHFMPFKLGPILSLTTGVIMAPMDEILLLAKHILGFPTLYDLQLTKYGSLCKRTLLEQHPHAALAWPFEGETQSWPAVGAHIQRVADSLGLDELLVAALEQPPEITDAITDLEEILGKGNVIAVSLPPPTAHVESRDGKVELHDPNARILGEAITRVHCFETAKLNAEALGRFRRRMTELGKTAQDVIITVLNGDDPIGARFAAVLMPGGWDAPLRAQGLVPFARGLADREGVQRLLDHVAPGAAATMKDAKGIVLVVADHNAIEIFEIAE